MVADWYGANLMKIFIPRRNIWTPQPRWGMKKYQRGIICATAVYASGAVVTVSGDAAADTGVNRAARAAIVLRSDGTVDQIENVTTTQIDTATDWIIPNSAAPDDYEGRYTGLVGDPLDNATSLAEDVWGALSSDIFFEQRADIGTDDDFSSSITIEVRKGSSGGAIDSATYTLDATNVTI